MLLDTHGGTAWGQVLHNVAHPPSAARLRDGLQAIEKVLVLEEMPVFSRATSDQLAALAGITREVKMTEGEVLFGAGDAPAIHIVLEGELSLEPMDGGTPMTAGAGDCTGVYETLGGLDQTGWRGHVTRGGVALRVDREALFDLLADQIDLLQGLFSALQRQTASRRRRGKRSTCRRAPHASVVNCCSCSVCSSCARPRTRASSRPRRSRPEIGSGRADPGRGPQDLARARRASSRRFSRPAKVEQGRRRAGRGHQAQAGVSSLLAAWRAASSSRS